MLLSQEALKKDHYKKHEIELAGRPIVLLASFPRNGNHYIRNLIHYLGMTTHSLHKETPFFFPPLNTSYLKEMEDGTPLAQPSTGMPFLIKTQYPALDCNLLPMNYSGLIFLVRNPVDNIFEQAKFQHKSLSPKKMLEILPSMLVAFNDFHNYWEHKCSMVTCLRLRFEDLVLESQVETLKMVDKFLHLGSSNRDLKEAFGAFVPQRAKVGMGLKLFSTRAIRTVMKQLGPFLSKNNYSQLVKSFLMRKSKEEQSRKKSSNKEG